MSSENSVQDRVSLGAVQPASEGDAFSFAFAASSHPGRVRANNQDYAFAGSVPGHPGWVLLVVADGVGGQARGEWASQLATETLAAHVAVRMDGNDPAATLADAITAANAAVFDGGGDDAASRPATTMVCALVSDGRAWWANVGDSRLYLVRRGAAEQLSADHSWVAEQVRAGQLTEAEAATSSRRNVITRSVGFEQGVTADLGELAFEPGDALVLCSDGVHGVVSPGGIAALAAPDTPAGAIAEGLISAANAAGAPDNATAVVGTWRASRVLSSTARLEQPRREEPHRWRGRVALLAAVGAALGAAIVARSL